MLPPLKADSKSCSSDVGSRGLGTTCRLLGAFLLLSSLLFSNPNGDRVCHRQPPLPEFPFIPSPNGMSCSSRIHRLSMVLSSIPPQLLFLESCFEAGGISPSCSSLLGRVPLRMDNSAQDPARAGSCWCLCLPQQGHTLSCHLKESHLSLHCTAQSPHRSGFRGWNN